MGFQRILLWNVKASICIVFKRKAYVAVWEQVYVRVQMGLDCWASEFPPFPIQLCCSYLNTLSFVVFECAVV